MFDRNKFLALVREDFLFLETEYGFASKEYEDDPRVMDIFYKKNELLVRIRYSKANDYIEVVVFNHTSVVKPGQYSWKYSIDLGWIIKKYEDVFFDFESLNRMEMSERTNAFAKLLKSYGDDILSEKDWFSWGDLSGHNQYVPPELP